MILDGMEIKGTNGYPEYASKVRTSYIVKKQNNVIRFLKIKSNDMQNQQNTKEIIYS